MNNILELWFSRGKSIGLLLTSQVKSKKEFSLIYLFVWWDNVLKWRKTGTKSLQ